MGMIHTVGLVLHPKRDSAPAIEAIVKWAATRQITVLGLPDEVGRIDCSAVSVSAEELADRATLMVSLGGDGTMLRTMRMIANAKAGAGGLREASPSQGDAKAGAGGLRETSPSQGGRKTPVLGVNLGRLGFLAEIDVDELPGALSAIDNHNFTIEPRMAVRTYLPSGEEITAFNDVALVRVPGDGQAAVGISVQGNPFVRYAADAVIVATTTGSTAYSFSAGGPIVSPTVEGILVVPAAAHSSFSRALVLAASEELCLDLLPSSGRLAVEVDGGVAGYLAPGDTLSVTALPAAAQVVRLGYTTFYERARRKLQVNGSAEVDWIPGA